MDFEQPQKTSELRKETRQDEEKESIESILAEVEKDLATLQGDLEKINTLEECYEIIEKLTDLYDKTLTLSNEIGYQPMTGKSQFPTPKAIFNEKKIEILRTRIHNFLMDVAWEKYEKIKYKN